jgi:hypothetical protein
MDRVGGASGQPSAWPRAIRPRRGGALSGPSPGGALLSAQLDPATVSGIITDLREVMQ